MTEDFMPLDGWDHIELWVGNAKQAAFYYEQAFGFPALRETISAALPTIVFVLVVYYFWGRSAWEKHLRALREARLVEATG